MTAAFALAVLALLLSGCGGSHQPIDGTLGGVVGMVIAGLLVTAYIWLVRSWPWW
jgi:hypothetical protein